MSIQVLPGTKETLDEMKGKSFVPHEGEGVVYLKIAFLKPDTIENGDPANVVEVAPGVVLCGRLDAIRNQIVEWFGQSAAKYKEE